MSVCLEPSTVLPTSGGAPAEPESPPALSAPCSEVPHNKEPQDVLSAPLQNVAKLVLASTGCSSAPVLQKVASSSVITVVNATGPLTILKTLCSSSCGTAAPQFTLVNSSTPLSVCNAVGKPITVVNAPPITVVRAISNANPPALVQTTEESTKTTDSVASSVSSVSAVNGSLPSVPDRPPIHNVFVKNTVTPDLVPAAGEVAQVQKLVPANSFLQNNVIQTISTSAVPKTANGQKAITGVTTNNKLKIISNVVIPPAGTPIPAGPSTLNNNNNNNNSNIILNKSVASKHYFPQQKTTNSSLNGAPKFVGRTPPTVTNNNFVKAGTSGRNLPPGNKSQKLMYPTHKSQLRTMPPVNNAASKSGIKTLSPQPRGGISNQQVQRTSSGLRTIPPQRPSKMPNKPNYIGKHAIQAQKFKNSHGGMGKLRGVKPPVPVINNVFPSRAPQENTGISYHQALTANILQSLGDNSGSTSYNPRGYDFPSRYEGPHGYSEPRSASCSEAYNPPPLVKPQTNLETLSFVCKVVLLDHNYNATPPTEPSRPTPLTAANPVQLNGANVGSYFSPPSARNRSSLAGSTNTLSTLSSVSSSSVLPSNPSSGLLQDDDAASDISCGSDRKLETEGEETDTAPEAEAVNNEDSFDHYGDYVTRCLCGFVHDDGFMIECDKCKVWQHVRCVIKSNKKVPDDYLCEQCDPTKPVDRTKARTLQQQWMRENQEREAKLRKEVRMREMKLKETLSDSDSSDAEQTSGNTLSKSRVSAGGRRKSDQGPRQNPRQRRDSSRPESVIRRNVKKKERKVTKKKTKPAAKSHSDEETQETWPQSSISQLPQLRQWIENYEEAVTNHYSPELRARISSIRINGAHSDLSAQMDTSVHKCRIHTQPLTGLKYLVSTMHLSPNTPVIELRGKYMLSTQHRGNTVGHGGTLTTRQHAQRPGPFLFFYRLHKDNTEVCVDTRTYGNDARFVRRSCKPNAELRHCIEKGVLHLYIVTIATVEKNLELTIKHESHDLAAVGTTQIACACGKNEECAVNKSPLKKNGETTDTVVSSSGGGLRKKRGRRTVSTVSEQEPPVVPQKPKEEVVAPPSPAEVKPPVETKIEPPEVKVEEPKVKVEEVPVKKEEVEECLPVAAEVKDEPPVKEEEVARSPSPPPAMNTRKSAAQQQQQQQQQQKAASDTEDKKETVPKEPGSGGGNSVDKRKLSREERKIEAYMKAFERMERQQLRRQEHQAKQAHRRESEPGPLVKEEDKSEPKVKRRRRKGRSRTVSTHSQARRNRLNSADSSYATSGDECLLSPTDSTGQTNQGSMPVKGTGCDSLPSKEAGLLLALANCENGSRNEMKSPIHDVDCNTYSANSSPETHLSSAYLLVTAAVGPLEPLEPSFKFPKTKKGLMNEWLNKSPECIQSASSISPSSLTPHIAPPQENNFYESTPSNSFYMPSKNLAALAQAANFCDMPSQPHGNAKKRWLRQAISEDQCDSPTGRPESPPLSEMVAPPKKRRLPRESLSTEVSPPTTPTNPNAPLNLSGGEENNAKGFPQQEERVEIVTPGADGDSPTRVMIDDAMLKERVAEMKQEIGACFRLPDPREAPPKDVPVAPTPLRCVLDPRLSRPMFNNSDHLVATVEKNLSIFGFEDQKADNATPTKRKLSITEYRQRKQLTVNEKMLEEPASEENTLSQSPPQKLRPRSDSASSATSFMSSDDEMTTPELPKKALSAFNSEPTELEKQRESVSLRLKKVFGLPLDEDSGKTALKMETLLSCDLGAAVTPKASVKRFSPTFTPPGSCSSTPAPPALPPEPSPKEEIVSEEVHQEEEEMEVEQLAETGCHSEDERDVQSPVERQEVEEPVQSNREDAVKPEMFYTPDEEDIEKVAEEEKKEEVAVEEVGKCDPYEVVEGTNYVPPFNNPVYPNSSFTSFGSVMDDDAPYEGRNPSPPPELNSASGSYTPP